MLKFPLFVKREGDYIAPFKKTRMSKRAMEDDQIQSKPDNNKRPRNSNTEADSGKTSQNNTMFTSTNKINVF